jgi:hypothetical protein
VERVEKKLQFLCFFLAFFLCFWVFPHHDCRSDDGAGRRESYSQAPHPSSSSC